MRYVFLDCEIDTDTYEFRSAGTRRPLEPQVFDLLRYLVENPNRQIGRDETGEHKPLTVHQTGGNPTPVWQNGFAASPVTSHRVKPMSESI